MHERLRTAAEDARLSADEARKAAAELRTASEIALKAAYDQSTIMQELRQTLLRLEISSDGHDP